MAVASTKHVIKFYLISKYFKGDEKQLSRGENSYTSGHVLDMKYHGNMQPPLITGVVQASMKKNRYTVEISFDLKKGVMGAKCTCPRGQTICHHMAALLYNAHYHISSTDIECQWNVRKKKQGDDKIQTLEELYPSKEAYVATTRQLTEEDVQNFREKIGQTNVVGFSWLLKPAAQEVIFNIVPDIADIIFSEEYFAAADKDQFLTEKCAISLDRIQEIAAATVGQHSNEGWLITRKMRLTASKFGSVLGACKRGRYPPSLFKQLLEGYNLNRALAVQWGKSNEETALNTFRLQTDFTVTPTGLWLDPCGFLGASPDGLVEEDAILEIKCPWKFRNMQIKEGVKDDKYFFNYDEEGEIVVNTNHVYYHQVQGQLYMTNRQICYFYIWTPNEQESFIIARSPEWANNINILKEFYLRRFIPAVFDLK